MDLSEENVYNMCTIYAICTTDEKGVALFETGRN